jgi:copper chaperone
MTNKTFHVPNISCKHCVMTIKRELGELEGVTSVTGDVETKMVTVEWGSPATWDGIQSLLAEINYPPAEPSN